MVVHWARQVDDDITNTSVVNSAFHPSGVGESTTSLVIEVEAVSGGM